MKELTCRRSCAAVGRVLATVAVLFGACAGTAVAQAAPRATTGDTAVLSWSAFECFVFAETAGKPQQELERLFLVGYENGKRFVDGVRSKALSQSEANKVPIGVLGVLAGPTTEFIVGRLYETAAQSAADRVIKRGPDGLDLPTKD